jgi:two-component system, NarL family, response regulator DesR
MTTGRQSPEDAYVADGTSLPAPALAAPLEDIDVLEPEPTVAVIADSAILRRRIVAAFDFDRLPVTGVGGHLDGIGADAGAPAPVAAVLAVDDDDAAVSALRAVRRRWPAARPVLVLERLRGGPLRRALRAGAAAVVEATDIETGLALAVRVACAGLVVVPESMRDRLEPPALTPREREVLALAAEGATTSEIAGRLTVSTGTVKSHLSSCFAKLGVENRSEALALLIDSDAEPAHAE